MRAGPFSGSEACSTFGGQVPSSCPVDKVPGVPGFGDWVVFFFWGGVFFFFFLGGGGGGGVFFLLLFLGFSLGIQGFRDFGV